MVQLMKYYDYKENIEHKTNQFPLAYYYVDSSYPRYQMMHHWHKEFEIILVSQGALLVNVDGREYRCEAGDWFFVNSGAVHSAVPYDCVYECVVFDLEQIVHRHAFSEKSFRALFSGSILLEGYHKSGSGPIENVEKLFKYTRKQNEGFEYFVCAAILEIFGYMFINGNAYKADKLYRRTAERLRPFESAVSYIENNYSGKISLHDLAKSAGISEKYFGEYFKKVSGKTPFEYLNEYRIERASEMLLCTDLPMVEIALNCGFNDQSYFTKTFKAQKGVTPFQYRKDGAIKH
ncbi:MAG: helix-turn-helix transcriptional regulator [Oscillospiraceae bacterium]|nr:helix-turn-helix transcriptional regulator [Candidatus Equicaccousia limihippi]